MVHGNMPGFGEPVIPPGTPPNPPPGAPVVAAALTLKGAGVLEGAPGVSPNA